MITTIETIRSVARHAQGAPGPEAPAATGRAAIDGLWPRLVQLVAGLLATNVTGTGILQVIAQALTTLLPLLNLDGRSTVPGAGKLTVQEKARLDLLRQERAARARQRAAHRARPDRPPANRRFPFFGDGGDAEPETDAWNDLLQLVSEALEAFIRFRDRAGIDRCVEPPELIAELFGVAPPEAA